MAKYPGGHHSRSSFDSVATTLPNAAHVPTCIAEIRLDPIIRFTYILATPIDIHGTPDRSINSMSAELTIAADLPSKHMSGNDHVDNIEEKIPAERMTGVSKFAHLTTHQAIFKFRRIFMMGLLASFGGM